MTLLTNGLEHFSSGSFIKWGGLWAAGKQPFMISCCAAWMHAWRNRCAGFFSGRRKIFGPQTPPRLSSTVPAGRRGCVCVCVCVCVCARTKPTAVFCFRCFLRKLPKHGLPAILPKAWQPESSCLKTSWFKTILESTGRLQRGPQKPLGRCASPSHWLTLGTWISLTCTFPSKHPHPLPSLCTYI